VHSGGLGLLECARVAAASAVPLDGLVGRVRRGGLPTAKLFQVVQQTSDVELLVLAIERLERGSPTERHAALELLDRSAPLPSETARLLAKALEVPGLDAQDIARLLLLLQTADIGAQTLAQLERASDPLVVATVGALTWRDGAVLRDQPWNFSDPLQERVLGQLLSRGMPRELACAVLHRLVARAAPLSPAALAALAGVPSDLSAAGVEDLALLAASEQGGQRDLLLSLLARQKSARLAIEQAFARGSAQDRRSLTAGLLHRNGDGPLGDNPLGDRALSDADPWVRAHAAQRAGSAELEQLLVLSRTSSPAFVRASALLGLSRFAPKRAAEAVDACSLLAAGQLGVRVGALRLVDRAGLDCRDRSLADIVLLEREPILRELAARALGLRDPGHRALRSCRAYDAEPDVADACRAGVAGERRAPGSPQLEFVEVVPPWLDAPAASCPYALLDGNGDVFIGVTDRRGQALVPGPASARLLDPRVAL